MAQAWDLQPPPEIWTLSLHPPLLQCLSQPPIPALHAHNSLSFHSENLSPSGPALVLTHVVKVTKVGNLAQGEDLQSFFSGCLAQGHNGRDVAGVTCQSDQFGQGYLAGDVARTSMPSLKSIPVLNSPSS